MTARLHIPFALALLAALPAVDAQAQMRDRPSGSSTIPLTADRYVPGQLMFSAEEERVYMERFNKGQEGRRVTAADAYDPQEPVIGAADWTPLPAAKEAERTISAAALGAARAYAADNNSDSFIVWRKGKVEAEAYFGDHTQKASIISKSLAKPVTTAAVGRAIMLGKIKSLDQPVADFVTEWKTDARKSKILVRHLLDMRSGFLPQANAPEPADILNRSYLHPRHDEIIVKEYPVVDEPGSVYEYNNATSEMVAVLIERATGRRYAEFVGAEVWRKLGALGGTVWVNRAGGTAHSGCCMMVPAENFVRLAVLFMHDGVWNGSRLLPEGYIKTVTTPSAQNPHAALGVYVAGRYIDRRGAANPKRLAGRTLHGEPYQAADLFLFDGNSNQVVYIVPSEDLVILRTGDSPPKTKDKEWDNAYLPNVVLRGIVKEKGASVPQPR
jgi:CubicO group peptidase (beta-lactamase class C family)